MSSRQTLLLFCVFTIAVLLSSCAQNKPTDIPRQVVGLELNQNTPLPISPNIVKGKLDNGLRYIIRENKTPENFAELRLIVHAGSLQEDDSQLGFAHFAEHMAFNGTRDFEKQEIIEYIEAIGMRFGAHLNAYTSFDETVYQLRVPSSEEGSLDKAFHILENWAHKISFDPQSIDDERGVVLEEWRSRKGAQDRIFKQRLPILMQGTLYAERLPIGSEKIIMEGKHEDLRRFYSTWYRPDLMSIVAVGDFDTAEVERLIQTYFNQLETSNKEVNKPQQVLTEYNKPVLIKVTDPEITRANITVDYRLPKEVRRYVEDMRDSSISQFTLGIINTRLSELAWKQESPFTYASVRANRNYTLGRNFSINVGPKPEQYAQSFEAVLATLHRIAQQGPTLDELNKQKKIYTENFVSTIAQQDTLSHNFYVSKGINHFTAGTPLASLEQSFAIINNHIDDISVQDIQVRLQEWIAKDDAIISITAPANVAGDLPEDETLLTIWDSSKTQAAQAYQPQQDVTELMQQIPEPGSVINKAFNEQWNAHVWTLSNGVNVVLKESQYKENTLRFWARSSGGYSLVDDEAFLQSFGMMSSIDSFGLGDLNVEQLNSYMQGKRFSVNARINTYTEELYGQTVLDSLTGFFQTMHLRFVGARKDPARFEWLKGLYQPQIEQRMNNPNFQFSSAISEAINSNNPRITEFDVDALNNQNLDTIFDIRTRSFSNASDFDFVFIGDLDLDEMERYLTTYVATLPSSESRDPVNILPDYAQSDFVEVNVPIGKEPKATVLLRYSGKAQWTYKNSLVLSALRASLENTLRVRLREELGGVYSVGVNGSMSRWPHQNYSIRVSFTCDPERIDELRSEVEQVFARYIAGDIDEQNLINFKTQRLLSREQALKENSFWLSYIMGSLSPRLPLPLDDFEPTINSITVEDLKDAANIYLIKNAGYFATLTPEPAASAAEAQSNE